MPQQDKTPISFRRFRTETVRDMKALGRAFVQAAARDARPADLPYGILRIGLYATPGSGKSTFARGFLNAVAGKIIDKVREGHRTQSLRETDKAGKIRHYDALIRPFFKPRQNYEMEELSQKAAARQNGDAFFGTDLVEHPDCDYDQRHFYDDPAVPGLRLIGCDYLLMFNRASAAPGPGPNTPRTVTVFCYDGKNETPGFQKFIEKSAPFLMPDARPRNDDFNLSRLYLR